VCVFSLCIQSDVKASRLYNLHIFDFVFLATTNAERTNSAVFIFICFYHFTNLTSDLRAPPYSVARNSPANPGRSENTVITKRGNSYKQNRIVICRPIYIF